MRPADQEKTAFVTEWGVFVAVVMNVRVEDGPNNILADHHGDIWRIHLWVYVGVPR